MICKFEEFIVNAMLMSNEMLIFNVYFADHSELYELLLSIIASSFFLSNRLPVQLDSE